MFGKLLGKKAGNMKAEMKKVENRDLMQAIIAGSLLVAKANGTIEKTELAGLEARLRANQNMAHFGSEITETMNRYLELLNSGGATARIKVMREIADIKNNQADAEECFANLIDMAADDGEIDAAEKKVLIEIGRALGQTLSNFGIEE